MSVIYNRNFASGNQRYLTLTTQDYLRPMSIGTSWSRIRIGMLYAMGTVSENAWPVRGCSLSLGVCNGIQNSPANLTQTHAFGWAIPSLPTTASPGNWGYNAGTGGNSYFSASGWTFFKIASSVYTTSNTGSVTITAPSNTTLGGAIARRGILILDISKSALVSGNISQGGMSGAVAHNSLDLTSSDLYSALEWYTTAPTIQGTALSSLAVANPIAFNESVNGGLDTVFLYWSHYTVPIQLYELAVYRVG
jgi:hypothetical protein